MLFGPILHEPKGPLRQAAFQDLGRVDVNLGGLSAIFSVEMRRRMVLGIHADDDPVKARNLRHEPPPT
jgi:hypothetical protein